MSDAMTDIKRDDRNTNWLNDNMAPILNKWLGGVLTDEQAVAALNAIKEKEDMPHYRGYNTDAPARTVDGFVLTVQHGNRDYVKRILENMDVYEDVGVK